ncbi:50S ribosomal protein L11 methyltransferase [Myxococcus sp. CA033]|uniref:50S ribosomal protein L11 methyltransferase n=1 Tax=Myxococcus sp. CA033 TaxID=2741516 RepID=UPI001C2D8606
MSVGNIAEHHRMLYDTVRVHAYRSSLFRHARDQVVLDIGTGTGLLAILAAKAGARHVYAIEESAIAEVALEMYAENGVADRIRMVIPPTAPQTLLARPCLLRDVQLDGDLTEAMNEQSVESVLEVNAPGILGGVAIYFRAHMDEHTVLSTSPSAPPTCWGFQVKEFKERVQVQPGDRVRIVSTLNRSHGHRFKIVLA